MSDELIKLLQKLGDGDHDDLSVAYDAIEEIIKLRLLLQEWMDWDAVECDNGYGIGNKDLWKRTLELVR